MERVRGRPGRAPARVQRPVVPTDRLVLSLAGAAVGLVAVGLLVRVLAFLREQANPGIAPPAWLALFDVNSEMNVPTWFSVVLLVVTALAAAAAGAVVVHGSRRAGLFLLVLGGGLLALSLDEIAGIHERLQGLGELLTGGRGPHFAWVVPGGALAVVGTIGVVLGARSLARPVRRRLTAGLVVFLAGALGLELLSGVVLTGSTHAAYLLVTSAEELLEMLGVVLVLRAVLTTVTVDRVRAGWTVRPA